MACWLGVECADSGAEAIIDHPLVRYLLAAFDASKLGYTDVFFVAAGLSAVGAVVTARLVRKPTDAGKLVA